MTYNNVHLYFNMHSRLQATIPNYILQDLSRCVTAFSCNNGFYARFYATSEHINITIFLKNVKSQSRASHPGRILSYIPGSTFRWDHLLHRKRNFSCHPANIWFIWDLRFLRRCWWRFQSSGIRLSVDQLESTDLSEKLTALLCLHIDSLR